MPRGVDRTDEARQQRRLWTPQQLRGLRKVAAWYDAGDPANISYATGVSTFRDSTGFQTATQGTGANQITWSPSGWVSKDRAALVGTGANKYVTLSTSLAYSGTDGFSAMSAVEQNGTAAIRNMYGGAAGSIEFRFNASHVVEIVRTNQALIASSAAVGSGGRLIGFDAATSLTTIWVDGAASHNSAANGAYTAPILGLCTNFVTGTNGFNGAWGETVFSVFKWTAGERQKVEGYLAWKWGLVANLPASHPYKNRPPLIGD
jgi:hypothetical protein